MTLCRVLACTILLFAPTVSTATETEKIPALELKPTGLSLEFYTQELELDVTGLNTELLNIPQAVLDSAKGKLGVVSDIEILNLRLDRQIRPYLNIFGSIGKVTDKTKFGFSRLGLGIVDRVTDNKGSAYGVGATLSHKHNDLVTSLHYVHNRIDLDDNNKDIVTNTGVSSLGVLTNMGIFSLRLVYQDVEAAYSRSTGVPIELTLENKDNFHALAGFQTRLAKDLYISSNVNLGGRKKFQLKFNKRF